MGRGGGGKGGGWEGGGGRGEGWLVGVHPSVYKLYDFPYKSKVA